MYYMEQSQRAFSSFAHLKVLFDKYEFDPNEENEKQLVTYLSVVNQRLPLPKGLPLPSGRYGSSLAVALEMHNYPSALLIIQHATEWNIDLERVSSKLDGSDIMSVKECFDFSLSYFENELDEEFYQRFPEHLEYNKRVIAASENLKQLLNQKEK